MAICDLGFGITLDLPDDFIVDNDITEDGRSLPLFKTKGYTPAGTEFFYYPIISDIPQYAIDYAQSKGKSFVEIIAEEAGGIRLNLLDPIENMIYTINSAIIPINGTIYEFMTLCCSIEIGENKVLHIVSDMFLPHKENLVVNFGIFRYFSLLIDALYLNGEKLITVGTLEPCKTQEMLEEIGREYDFKEFAEQYPEGFEYYDYDSMLDDCIRNLEYFRIHRFKNKYNDIETLINKVYENINSEI